MLLFCLLDFVPPLKIPNYGVIEGDNGTGRRVRGWNGYGGYSSGVR